MKEFFDDAQQFSRELMADDACKVLAAPATQLTLDASILQALVVVGGEADDDSYLDVAKSGDGLAKALGETDTKFERP